MLPSLFKKLTTSRRVLLIGFIVMTVHYLIVIYHSDVYSTDKKLHDGNGEDNRRLSVEMHQPIAVVFPVNIEYYPEKAPSPNVQMETNKVAKKIDASSIMSKPSANKTLGTLNNQPAEYTKSKDPKSGNPHHLTQLTSNSSNAAAIAATVTSKSTKLILAWTPLHSRKPLWGIRPWTFRKCQYKNCEVTGNRSMLSQADLLIFRIRELKANMTAMAYRMYVRPIDYTDLPPYHKPNQVWMDINQESPVYTQADEELAGLEGIFNLSVNYLLNSDYTLSYIPEVKVKAVNASRGSAVKTVDYSAGKTKMALWFVSHCGAASGRDKYVKELEKYNISVDVFGKCTGKSDGCRPGNYTCYDEIRSRYKFYLAFENSICSEYITEKFWNTLTSTSYNVPIALGASLEHYKKFSPPSSYLHTRNFTSVKALADFMNKLDKDNDAYNSFHRWRETHQIVPRHNDESLQCYMCRQANIKQDGKAEYKHLTKYWSRKKNCDINPEPMR